MFCLLVVLVKMSVLAKWWARKTPLRRPNLDEGIVSRKPRLKSAYDFLGLLYCFIVLLCVCVVFWPYVIYFPTLMAWYSLFVLKMPLNTSKQTSKLWFNVHFCWWTWVSWYQNVSILGFIGAKSDGGCGYNWSCKTSNLYQHQTNTQLFTGQIPFLSHNPQCQSTEWMCTMLFIGISFVWSMLDLYVHLCHQ